MEGTATLAVRPDDFEFGHGPIEADVTNVFYLGEKVRATARLADGTEVTADIGRHDGVVSGDRIALDIDTEHLHVVKR